MAGPRDNLAIARSQYGFGEDYFGESLTYKPLVGEKRTIRGKVTKIASAEIDGLTTDQKDRIEVLVGRDESDETDGGVNNPQPGDTITRTAAIDPDQRPYMFRGDKEVETRDKYRLVFERMKRTSQGTKG